MTARILGIFTLIVLLFSACKKQPELEDKSYICECGSISWQGLSYDLLDAEYIQFNDTLFFSRQYYASTDVRDSRIEVPHSLNFQLHIEDITQGVFFPEVDTLVVSLEEVNFADPISNVREFGAFEGVINVNPGLPGTTETVSFSLNMKEIINGQLVGFPIPLSGSLSIE